jgi:hypothetical protein
MTATSERRPAQIRQGADLDALVRCDVLIGIGLISGIIGLRLLWTLLAAL